MTETEGNNYLPGSAEQSSHAQPQESSRSVREDAPFAQDQHSPTTGDEQQNSHEPLAENEQLREPHADPDIPTGNVVFPPITGSSKGPPTSILKGKPGQTKKSREDEEYAEENAQDDSSDEESVESEVSSEFEGSDDEDEDYDEEEYGKPKGGRAKKATAPRYAQQYQSYPGAPQVPYGYPAGVYPGQPYYPYGAPMQQPRMQQPPQGAPSQHPMPVYPQQMGFPPGYQPYPADPMQRPFYPVQPGVHGPHVPVQLMPSQTFVGPDGKTVIVPRYPPMAQMAPPPMANPAFAPQQPQQPPQQPNVAAEGEPAGPQATAESALTTSQPAQNIPTSGDQPQAPSSAESQAAPTPPTIQVPTAQPAQGAPISAAAPDTQPSPRAAGSAQLMNLLNDIATLPPQEQASVVARLVAQHAQVTNASPEQAGLLKQRIERLLHERMLQRLHAGMPMVPSPTTPSQQQSPATAGQVEPGSQFPGYGRPPMPMMMPMPQGQQPYPGGMPYQPGAQMRPVPMYPMQPGAYAHVPMTYHGHGPRPQLPPNQRSQYPPYSQGANRSTDVFIPEETKLRPRRAATKNVKYTFDEEEQEEEEEEEEEEETHEEAVESPVAAQPVKAASGATKKAKPKKAAKQEETIDEEELDQLEEEAEQEGLSVEKIISYRRTLDARGEEFLVKYRGKSYLHVEWIPRSYFMGESGGAARVKRFLSKPLSQHHFSPQHVFNPKFTEVDKIIGEWKGDDGNLYYLVKWCEQPYEQVTWESKEDILNRTAPTTSKAGADVQIEKESHFKTSGQQKLAEFQERKIPPIQTAFMRPSLAAWNALQESPKYKDGHELRKYQLEGLNWLTFCWLKHQSCIIADEMGLGKTVQTVSFLDLISTKFKAPGPFLVVAPLSTLPHWEREFRGWTNLRVLIYHGSQPTRDVMYEYEFFYLDAKGQPIQGVYKFDVVITTYEMANLGATHLRSIPWKVGIFDEAHRLKNIASKSSENLKLYRIEHKILATGTPIQNSLDELFALLNFMEPNKFPDQALFHAHFGNLRRSEDVQRLQELLRPIMLRRLKEDVEKTIPVKEETIIEVELTAVQKRLYRAILEKNLSFLMKGAIGTNVSNLMNTMMELRKCCIHPYLIKGSEEAILADYQPTSLDDQYNCMISACGKLVLLDKLLRRLHENDHKVLIFSQMTKCLDLLEDYLKYKQYPHERIDGTIRGDLRQASIDRFNDPTSNSFVFLLCTRAGGVGINLTSADTVVIFDSDWNPQNDLQAQARCHRIGQTKSVKVYRLITRGTYEREMFDRAGLKLGLDKAVLQHMGPTAGIGGSEVTQPSSTALDKKEIETLLKKGAYGLVMENDEDSVKFCEEDIDQILARRTVVVKHDSANGEGQQSAPSIFSKASFTASAEDEAVDMDDPNFWENWAKRLNTDSSTLQQSISTDEPRLKRHFKRLRAFEAWNPSILDEVNSLKSVANDEIVAADSTAELHLWGSEERTDFIRSLLLFGANSDKVQQSCDNRSSIEIYSCIKAFVRNCIDQISPQDSDTKFKQDIEKTLLGAIATITDTNPNVQTDEDAQQQESIPTWLREMTFSKDEIPFPNASKLQCFQFVSFLRKSNASTKQFIQNNAYECLMRLLLLEFFRQVCEYYGVSQERASLVSLPMVGGTLGFEANWSKQDDNKLLLSIQQSGFCKETIEQLQFSTDATVDEVIGRFKKVIISLEKRSQTESRLQMQALKDSSVKRRRPDQAFAFEEQPSETVIVRSRNKRSPLTNLDTQEWNEDTPLTRAILTVALQWGLPSIDENTTPYEQNGPRDWSVFRSKSAQLESLTDERLELLGQSLITCAHAVADGRTRRGRAPKGTQREEREPAADEPVLISLADICFPFSVGFAKKLLKVVDLFDLIRLEILPKADLLANEVDRKIRRTQGIPKWWDAAVHDLELAQGLEKHGVSPDGLEALFKTDDEFSFSKHRLTAPLDQQVVFKRIESIVDSLARCVAQQQRAVSSRPSPKQQRSFYNRTSWEDEGEDAYSLPSDASWDESAEPQPKHRKLRNQPDVLPMEEAPLDDLDDLLVAPSADQCFEMLAHSLPIKLREFYHDGHCELHWP